MDAPFETVKPTKRSGGRRYHGGIHVQIIEPVLEPAMNQFQSIDLNVVAAETINTNSSNKSLSSARKIYKTKSSKKRVTPSWELLLESANRAEQVGRSGVEVYGRFYSSAEIGARCREIVPLPPFKRLPSMLEVFEAHK